MSAIGDRSSAEGDAFAALSTELRGLLDPDGGLELRGSAWSAVLGWGAEVAVGRTLAELAHPDDLPAVQRLLDELRAGRPVDGLTFRLRHHDAAHRWIRWRAAPHPGPQLGYLVGQDVTDHDRDRAALALLERQSGVGTWEVDVGSGQAVWSTVTHALHGTDPADGEASVALGLSRYPPQAREQIEAAFDRLVATGEGYDLELPFLASDGSERWIRTAGRAIDRDGVVIRVYGTLEDVTDRRARRQQRKELEETRALLEEAQQLARIGYWYGDLGSDDLTCSPVVYDTFGLDPEQRTIDRHAILELVHPEDRAAVREAGRWAQQGGAHAVDYRVMRHDGQVRHVHHVVRTAPGEPGEPDLIFGTVQDLTELRVAEQTLRASQEQLARVLAATNDGWWDLDFAAGTSFYSDRWWQMCGYEPGELPDEPEPWRQLTHPDDRPRFEAEFEAVLAAGARTFVLPSAGLHRDGHRVPMVVRGLVEYDAEGVPVRMSGATTDVTEARQAEAAKEEFVSTVSHELRTPLTSIGGALESLGAGVVGELPAGAQQLIAVAQRNTRRLRLLIDDLLDLERLLSDRLPFDHRTQPLTPLLVAAVEDNQPYAAAHDVTFVLRPPDAEVVVTVDPARLAQVLANYLSNAAKFAPAGSDVEVRARPDPDGAKRIRVEVIDRGPGVPDGFEDRIFDKFVQADPADPRNRGGTGLGLAISREIVERHGGRTGIESRPGRTCAWFDLPLTAAAE